VARAVSAKAGTVDFRSGEQLCSYTDELFKDMVEVDGEPRRLKWLRVPDESVG
jgi:hypothetical protein